jgi:signal transduction histidine kinase
LTDEWDELSEADRKNFLKNIRSTAHNTFSLLERLLEWSRLQTGKMKLVPGIIRLDQMVNETLSLLGPEGSRKFIRFNTELADGLQAWADRDGILLVLRNLISNAIKFTRHGGQVTVSAAPMNKLVVVTVSDSGVGISQENQKKLFQFESQFKTEGTDHEKGTGLGLVLCKEIIEKSGGRIWAESTEGEGSRFSFTLPAKPD